jgi:hypothetical protein
MQNVDELLARANAEMIRLAEHDLRDTILSGLVAAICAQQAEIERLKALMKLKLPCDIHLPPATIIRAGCTVETLIAGIRVRLPKQEELK